MKPSKLLNKMFFHSAKYAMSFISFINNLPISCKIPEFRYSNKLFYIYHTLFHFYSLYIYNIHSIIRSLIITQSITEVAALFVEQANETAKLGVTGGHVFILHSWRKSRYKFTARFTSRASIERALYFNTICT